MTPRWPLSPLLLRSYVWLYPRIILSKSHENMSKVCEYSDPFFKTFNQRSLTLRWPLTPNLLRSHVCLYPMIIASKSHENTVCGYSDPFFKNFNQRWPIDDLWPHICWSHMCDSTQESLCPSPMGIHQCMWIQWSILQNTTYILRTYILCTEWVIIYWTKFRRDKKATSYCFFKEYFWYHSLWVPLGYFRVKITIFFLKICK